MRLLNTSLCVAAACGLLAGNASAGGGLEAISLELRVDNPVVLVNSTVTIDLFAVSNAGPLAAAEVIFDWPTSDLTLLGLTDPTGGMTFEGFPVAGSNGLNESNPPADGDGLYIGFAQLGTPIVATPAGTRLTSFEFTTDQLSAATTIGLPATGGTPARGTVVFSGIIPNTDVTGTLTGVTIQIVDCGPADLDNNGVLDIDDVLLFLDGFANLDPISDLAPPIGTFDIDDVLLYLDLFALGCQPGA